MSSILLSAEQIAALAEIATKFIALIGEVQAQGATDATEAWKDTVTAFQQAQSEWQSTQALSNASTIDSANPGVPTQSESPATSGAVATERVAKAWST